MSIAAVVGIAGGWYAKHNWFSDSPKGDTQTTASSTPISGNTESPASSTAPSLIASVTYANSLSPEVRALLEQKIATLRSQLSNNYDLYNAWLDLAIRYKQAGDLAKAQAIWEYLAFLHPDDAVSRHNLGDLYANYLKQYDKAEQYYKQAIALQPTQSLDYLALADLYHYGFKKDSRAIETLKLGISRVSERQADDLRRALDAYTKTP